MKISGGTIFLIFLILKLTGLIHWSWLWVTSPLWLPFVILLPLLALGVALGMKLKVKK